MSGLSLYALYKAQVSLWVEDELTREVLTNLWLDRDISVHNAGGKEIAREMVKQQKVPTTLLTLKAILRQKAGLP